MRSGRLAKSVEAKLEKARARGEKVLRSPREKRALGPAGRQAGALASEPARWRAGGGPSAPSRTAFKQKTSPPESPRAPRPARPPPAPHTRSAGVPGPADQPSALPGGPAYLCEAACPGEREARSPVSRGRSGRAPSPWHARRSRRRRREPVALGATRPRGAWVKPAAPRRAAAAAPHRAAPSSPGPRPCPPSASAPDSGAVAVAAAALPSRRRGPGSQAPIAARRALTHTHTAAGWTRLGIPGRTDPFPPFFPSPPNFHVFITGLGHY